MRKKIAAGNWKMFKSVKEARDFFREWETLVANAAVKEGAVLAKDPAHAVSGAPGAPIAKKQSPEVIIFPSSILLTTVADATLDMDVEFGPQNIGWQQEGAFTGETSAVTAKEIGATFALIGHSERRSLFHEADEMIAKKVAFAESIGLVPMLCVGETLEEREKGQTEKVVAQQLKAGLSQLAIPHANLHGHGVVPTEDPNHIPFVIAYEPVWAIGTGKVATPEQAETVHTFLREQLKALRGSQADSVPILYGGSVKPDNAVILAQRKNIDGFLVGGASLKPSDFLAIANAL